MSKRMRIFLAGSAMVAVAALIARFVLFAQPELQVDRLLAGYHAGGAYNRVEVRYPLDGAVFPPESIPPTFAWNDECDECDTWVVSIAFADSQLDPMSYISRETRWVPSDVDWETVKKRSSSLSASVTVLGINQLVPAVILSAGTTSFSTSEDEVAAPVFYREVNLPFSDAVRDPSRIRWRCGPISSPQRPRVVLENMPVCGNCHSFSADGAVMGMDVDYANDKGSYAIAAVEEEITLDKSNVITWGDYARGDGTQTYGLLSQVSPDGKYVISTVKDKSVFVARPDLAFSQLFFPIRGVLAVYNRETGEFRALPGADDQRFVQSNPTWSPDGSQIVFARSQAYTLAEGAEGESALLTPEQCDEFLTGGKKFLYDLYRIPFNDGRGGQAEPLDGASGNGMSNYFPKYSPDGKWIVFCQSESFMLLQADSQLYIMPASGGQARRMRCNLPRMNSWHSWAPNSRWMVFSSKPESPYTQLFLTHIDQQGQSSPPVLLEQFSAKDRAANIPEFVNVEPGRIQRIREQFVDEDSYLHAAMGNRQEGNYEDAEKELRKAIQINPSSVQAHVVLGRTLSDLGRHDEGRVHVQKALELDPDEPAAYFDLGDISGRQGKFREAAEAFRESLRLRPENGLAHFRLGVALLELEEVADAREHLLQAVEQFPESPAVSCYLGIALLREGQSEQAVGHLSRALELNGDYPPTLQALASIRATDPSPSLRNAEEAVALATRACERNNYEAPEMVDTLGTAFAEAGQFSEAVQAATLAIELARGQGKTFLADDIQKRIDLYRSGKPFRRAE